ncbi:6-bladed beta-propeller [Planctomycetota bacterium]
MLAGLKRYFGGVFLGGLIVCSGCSPTGTPVLSSSKTPLVWPAPPEQARIRYVGMIDTEEDVKEGKRRFPSLSQVLFGKKDLGVLLAPSAVATDSAGRLFVADRMGGVVHVFNFKTNDYYQFGALRDDQTLQSPVGVMLVSDVVFVVDSQLRQVCVFDTQGTFHYAFGGEQLKRPAGIAYLPSTQEVCIVDTADHNLKVFHRSGRYQRTLGGRGVQAGHFNFPTHLWVDQSERLFVSDTLNYRVQVLDRHGVALRSFGQHGDRPGFFGHPCGVATDSLGHIYVIDRQFENVQVFDQNGRVLMAFGQEGKNEGEFWLPSGLCIDGRNWIYVADTYNKRIQIFKLVEGEEGNSG